MDHESRVTNQRVMGQRGHGSRCHKLVGHGSNVLPNSNESHGSGFVTG